MCIAKNENSGETQPERVSRLETELHAQVARNKELQQRINDLERIVSECYDLIRKQSARIQVLENQLEHEKKKNLSGSENSDASQDKI
ncbi:unnamed protein product [Adineta ricciae]|uniref:Uncharacterized protein n=1 Tax=Adineta ricciae TaxID=249248 RepID=A0A815SQZ3_ADIRI|nr:unnamed protein product [Adineta ricciae]